MSRGFGMSSRGLEGRRRIPLPWHETPPRPALDPLQMARRSALRPSAPLKSILHCKTGLSALQQVLEDDLPIFSDLITSLPYPSLRYVGYETDGGRFR